MSNAGIGQHNLAKLRRTSDRKKDLTYEEVLLHIGMYSRLTLIIGVVNSKIT